MNKKMHVHLIEEVERFVPWNEQEKKDKEQILDCLKTVPDIFYRENALAHMTASAWVINKTKDKVLMVYHNIYDSWSWLGGHADGEEDLLQVAIREVREESGLREAVPISQDIFSMEILTVDGHEKRGEYISSHLHYNITYLLEAEEEEILSGNPEENSAVGWFTLEDAVAASTEPWFQERIYKKLNQKLRKFMVNFEDIFN